LEFVDPGLAWTAAGTVTGAAALVLGVPQLVISWLDHRDDHRVRMAEATDVGPFAGAAITPPLGRLTTHGLRGRDLVMRTLWRALRRRAGRMQVIAGMGGVGKSAVALALCSRARRRQWYRPRRPVWWLSAADEASLTSSAIGLAHRLGGTEQDLKAIAQGAMDAPDRLWALLERARSGWLLVVDNADEPDLLAAPRPAGSASRPPAVADGTGWIRPTRRGLIVVTSRISDRQVWGLGQADVYRLGVLGPDDAAEVLLDLVTDTTGVRTGRRSLGVPLNERRAARDLAARLGGLPLALHLAGAAIGSDFSSWASFSDYRTAMDAVGVAMLEPDRDTPSAADPRVAVARTWELSLDALAAHQIPQARPLLRLLSCYAPAVPIPATLLADKTIAELLAGPNRSWTMRDVMHARHALARVGLIDVVGLPGAVDKQQGIVVHPLVADTNRNYLTTMEADEAATAVRHLAITLLAQAAVPLDFTNTIGTADWPRWRLFAPHVQALLTSVAADLPADDLAVLLDIVARTVNYYIQSGAYRAGHELGRVALTYSDGVSADHAAVIHLRFRFARSTLRLGRWDQAATLFREVIDDMTRVLGAEHRETLIARVNAAWSVGQLGHWAEAETEDRQVLQDMIRLLGPDHLYTLATRSDLAFAAGELGRWQQSETESRKLLDDITRTLGPNHTEMLYSRLTLARAVGRLGRLHEAEAELGPLLEDMTRLLGPDHPHTLRARREHARVIGELGRTEQAATEQRQLVDDIIRVLGEDHPDTLSIRRELGESAPGTGQSAGFEGVDR
jgi:hypothetical protein